MGIRFFIIFALALVFAPAGVSAQGIVQGAEDGSADGAAAAGPIGAVVGGAVGAVTGGVGGLLGIDLRSRFHDYVRGEHHSSYLFLEPLKPGSLLPPVGVTYYPVPPEFGVSPEYRYAIVNDEAVIVDPRTGRIVEIID